MDVDASLPTLALHQPQGLKSIKESKWVAKLKDCVVRAQVMAMEHMTTTTLKKAMILDDQITMALFTMHED